MNKKEVIKKMVYECDLQDKELMFLGLEIFKKTNKISKTLLQRKLQIGFKRASRIIEMMIELGYVELINDKYVLKMDK